MGHHHHHHVDPSTMGERRLLWAVAANVLLTLAQILGGVISGSLSLIADALHNFGDAASLFIALVAIRIGKKPADNIKTFGYKRAETIAALINLTSLVIIGLYLVVEACKRFYAPEPIEGWIVIAVAGVALSVDIATALLTYSQSKSSLNIKAAFIHNVSDALASVAVIVAGTLIILYGWVWVDAALTLLIAGYIFWQGIIQMPKVINLLMEGMPEGIDVKDVMKAIEALPYVENAHHLHIWQLDEHRNALEVHVVIEDLMRMDAVKKEIKVVLNEKFSICHSTLEFETVREPC